jgi:hypothetical protein
MHRHAVAATWGRVDLASSDMMSLETAKRVRLAWLDPRRQTPSIGLSDQQEQRIAERRSRFRSFGQATNSSLERKLR